MSWTSDITGALTVQVLVQFINLYQRLQGVHLSHAVADRLEWRWSANGTYSSRSAYATLLPSFGSRCQGALEDKGT
jgi:hypothetical protein